MRKVMIQYSIDDERLGRETKTSVLIIENNEQIDQFISTQDGYDEKEGYSIFLDEKWDRAWCVGTYKSVNQK